MTNPIVERLRERASRIAFIWRATNSTDKPSEDAVLMMDAAAEIERLSAELEQALGHGWKFRIGDRVTKISGSSWTGKVAGFYSSSLTPRGYNIESENEPGSVQLYPERALKFLEEADDRT